MKFSIKKTGQTGLLVSLCILASACNPDEFFPIEEFLTGDDAICYEAKDLDSCRALADKCQPAFVESDDEAKPLDFLVCIANPSPIPVDDGSTVGGTDGGSTTGGTTDGSAAGGTDGGSTTGGTTDGSAAGGTDGGSTTGGTSGSSTNGGNNGNANGGNNGGNSGGVVIDPGTIPTLEDAYDSKCQNLSSEYLWEKTETKKGKVIGKTSKVKVCHMTGNGSSHTIVIACPALKAHIPHQDDDYLGACY